ncbi:hypothetical protein NUW58_g631 [Xylaria curta]|uniref:Uncharacterized protein n=1 Tax=Xylaria curta TaxID=42375 RepID=A0ACC1PQ67_9PEZI|nr:hypothetical protein NUW58_g631 [Xylaria curta]
MDKYESIHGRDVASFDFASTHRLPTVSAAQALDDLKTRPRQLIPTGLEALDQALAGVSHEDGGGSQRRRGIRKGPGPAARRFQVLQYLISALQKLSATRDILIVVLSQCATRMQHERGATIAPAISASTWEQGIATRLVLFQDWTMIDAELRNVRLVGVQKSNGQLDPNGIGLVCPFEICNDGLVGLDLDLALATNPHRHKRKFDETDREIADSEGEDYGWEDEDEAEMPNMPPQWQGSEDLLLGRAEEDDNVTTEMSEPEGPYEREQRRHHNSP